MKIGVMVLDGPYQHEAADSAYHFVMAARARGHEIVGIFLFADGVNNANQFINPPGERNIGRRFEELGAQGIDIVACTACAKFRGLKPSIKVEHARLSGLGTLAEYLRKADRFVTFGD
jgi:tRNA 2-thiouridine synthesizing protein D